MVTNELSKELFQGPKYPQNVKFGCLLLFANFLKNFLGMILINCQDMDLIALFKMSFPWLERSDLAHCPISIAIIQ